MTKPSVFLLLGGLILAVIAGVSLFSGGKPSPKDVGSTAEVVTGETSRGELESSDLPGARPRSPITAVPAPKAAANRNDPTRPLFQKAMNSIRDGNVEAGIEQLQEILKIDPNNIAALTELGAVHMDKDQDKAAEYFEKAIKVNPNNSFALTDLVEVYEMQGKNDKARTLLADLAKANPDSETVMREMGEFYMRKGNPQEAIAYIERATALSGSSGTALADLAGHYVRAGNSQKAVETYNKSIQTSQEEMSRLKGAGRKVTHHERSIALTRLDLARVKIERGEFEAAEQLINQTKGVLPNDRSANALLKEIEQRQGAG